MNAKDELNAKRIISYIERNLSQIRIPGDNNGEKTQRSVWLNVLRVSVSVWLGGCSDVSENYLVNLLGYL